MGFWGSVRLSGAEAFCPSVFAVVFDFDTFKSCCVWRRGGGEDSLAGSGELMRK